MFVGYNRHVFQKFIIDKLAFHFNLNNINSKQFVENSKVGIKNTKTLIRWGE